MLLLLSGVSSRSYAQTESVTSRIYFPGSIGLNLPFDDSRLHLKNGTILTTALEYRPVDGNAIFIRFNYDAIHNHYQQVYSNSPTNVNTGKLSADIFSLGLGYRRKAGSIKLFGILQPGLAINSYDRVNFNPETISIDQISRHHLSIKLTSGIEYYLAEHFALTLESSYFYLSPRGNYKLLNPSSLNFNIGFTTTLF
ncbi:porin family protein [Mucilaginibacter sp. HC2]|uniref:outer membrane beta-barrel protein n=1 Tax=Mucilaginibacter inviolabilis TaxID=2714892 RepID=UPI001409CA2F|nr:outer membrane beta-barrel protein [Mucilaginibacter inviolabilis]NHA02421.1 porin family protein [Mucilaginibacter inviolabilis]